MQDPNSTASSTAPTPSKNEFVKVEGGEPERTSAEGSVVVAYSLMWAIMVFFVWRTLKGATSLTAEADRLLGTVQKGTR